MKKSKINEVFVCYRELLPITAAIQAKTGVLSDAYDELIKQLTAEQIKAHQKFVDALADENLEEVDFYFAEGFKLGLQIGMEGMEE